MRSPIQIRLEANCKMEPSISVISSIFIGVISGVITSALIWATVELFKNTILPWYQSVIYRGQEIAGEWEGYDFFEKRDAKGVEEKKCSIIHLEQKGNNISGNLILIRQPQGQETNKRYNLNGFFYDDSLVLTYEIEDKTRFGLGTCVFRLVNDGQKLEGYWTAINANSLNVFSNSEYWLRKE